MTFLPQVTINVLAQYFELRREEGEAIKDATPILRSQKSVEIGGIRRKIDGWQFVSGTWGFASWRGQHSQDEIKMEDHWNAGGQTEEA